jgi:hypothetical protein
MEGGIAPGVGVFDMDLLARYPMKLLYISPISSLEGLSELGFLPPMY